MDAEDPDRGAEVEISLRVEIAYSEFELAVSEGPTFAGDGVNLTIDGSNIRVNYPNGGQWTRNDNDADRIFALFRFVGGIDKVSQSGVENRSSNASGTPY